MRLVAAALALTTILCGCGGSDVDNPPLARSDKAVAFQIDAAHTGVGRIPGASFPASAAWTKTFADPLSYPLIADGRVFVLERGGQGTSHPSRLHALDRDTGAVSWGPVDLPGTFPAAGHAFDRGKVFVATYEGLVLSFDAATGQPGWSAKLPNSYAFVTAPTAIDGLVYVSDGGTNRVVALDGSNGAIAWSSQVSGGGSSIPSVADGLVIVAYPCQYHTLDAKTGNERWHFDGQCSGVVGGTVPIAHGIAFVRDREMGPAFRPVIDLRNAGSGASAGQYLSPGLLTQLTIPAVTETSVFLLEGFTLRRFDNALSRAIWSFAGDGTLTSAPLVVDTAVVIAGMSGVIYAVDATTGLLRWSAQLPSTVDDANDLFGTLPTPGLAVGEGYLLAPARNTLTAFRLVP